MYMNGHGPMMGGHRGPMGGPMHNRPMGFGPGMGYRRPYRPMGFFPMGGLFILPALMFGGWIVVAVLSSILSLVGAVIGGVFEGLGALASGAFSGSGLVIGIVIGLVAFYYFKKRKEAEPTSTIDGEDVEAEPIHYSRMGE